MDRKRKTSLHCLFAIGPSPWPISLPAAQDVFIFEVYEIITCKQTKTVRPGSKEIKILQQISQKRLYISHVKGYTCM